MRFHHNAVPVVLLVLLLDSIGFGIVLPVLPGLVVHLGHVGLPQATRIAGYMLATYAIMQFFAGPIIGNLGDRFGRRLVLLSCVVAFAIDYGLMAAAPSIGWLFLGRAIAGIAGASYSPATAVLADITPPAERGKVFGFMGGAFGIGFILGPAIGGLLSGFGTRAPFIAAAALAAVNAVWILASLPETLSAENRRPFEWRRANPVGTFKPLLTISTAAPLLIASFLWQLAHNVYPATWAFWSALALHWNAKQIGWSLAAAGLAMAATQVFLAGRAVSRFGEERCIVAGMLAGGISFAAYAVIDTGWMVYPVIVFSALQGLVFPSINALLSRMTDAQNQGALQGGMASIASIASIVGPLVMTQMLAFGAERGWPGSAFALAAGFVAIGLLFVWFGVLRRLRPVAEDNSAPGGAL